MFVAGNWSRPSRLVYFWWDPAGANAEALGKSWSMQRPWTRRKLRWCAWVKLGTDIPRKVPKFLVGILLDFFFWGGGVGAATGRTFMTRKQSPNRFFCSLLKHSKDFQCLYRASHAWTLLSYLGRPFFGGGVPAKLQQSNHGHWDLCNLSAQRMLAGLPSRWTTGVRPKTAWSWRTDHLGFAWFVPYGVLECITDHGTCWFQWWWAQQGLRLVC